MYIYLYTSGDFVKIFVVEFVFFCFLFVSHDRFSFFDVFHGDLLFVFNYPFHHLSMRRTQKRKRFVVTYFDHTVTDIERRGDLRQRQIVVIV